MLDEKHRTNYFRTLDFITTDYQSIEWTLFAVKTRVGKRRKAIVCILLVIYWFSCFIPSWALPFKAVLFYLIKKTIFFDVIRLAYMRWWWWCGDDDNTKDKTIHAWNIKFRCDLMNVISCSSYYGMLELLLLLLLF